MRISRAFTVIELVFVIVVLGILAAIAIPKFAATRDDANVARARATVAAVRSGIINERQTRLFRGDTAFINRLDAGVATNAENVVIFDNNGSSSNTILMYGVTTKNRSGHWLKTGSNQYTISIAGNSEAFTYNATTGIFDCDHSHTLCKQLTE